MDPIESTPESTAQTSTKKKGFFKRNLLWIILVSLLMTSLVVTYVRSEWRISQVETTALLHQQEVEIKATQILDNSTKELLLLGIKGFDWAIRGELLRGNEEQVQQYLTQLVKEDRIQLVEFINSEGMIQMSSDKNREGTQFQTEGFSDNPLQSSSPVYHLLEEESVQLFAPVMGLEKKAGTFRMVYVPEKVHFDSDSSSVQVN
jgi:hypothetical protein